MFEDINGKGGISKVIR